MKTIFNAYQLSYKSDIGKDKYIILFGNREEGWLLDKTEVCEFWAKAIRMSQYMYFGDVTLLSNISVARSLINANVRILDKNSTYKYESNKVHYTKDGTLTINGNKINGSIRFDYCGEVTIKKLIIYVSDNEIDGWNMKQIDTYIKRLRNKSYITITSTTGESTPTQKWIKYIITYK